MTKDDREYLAELRDDARQTPRTCEEATHINRLKFLLAQIDKRDEALQVLRRYHGGDGTVTRERVCEALGEE